MIDGLRADVEALAGMARGSAGPGERAAADWAAARLRSAGVADVSLEPYRWPRTHAWAHLPHLALAAVRHPLARAAALVLYELDQSGRLPWVQRLLPQGEGVTVVGRIPAAGGPARRTFVLVAHLDAQRAGVMWDRRVVEAGAGRRLHAQRMAPAALPAALAMASGRRSLLALVAAFVLDTARRGPVPGANDNASGVAAVLAVASGLVAEPLEGTEVLVVLPGAEEAGMGGMRAWLRGASLDPATTFVLGLDTVGSGVPVVARAEGALLPHAYRPEDLALVDAGARRAGVEAPQRWRIAAYTDPVLARFAGLPCASVLSVSPQTGMYTRYHRPDDVPEHVDLACVRACAALAEGVGHELDALP